MLYVTLPNGHSLPQIGFGTWKAKPEEVDVAITSALDAGYRHFDCAYVYKNEFEIGKVLRREMVKRNIDRSELFITSKLWTTFHDPKNVKQACKNTLKNLDLDYIDLYLIHWPVPFKNGEGDFPTGPDGLNLYEYIPHEDTWRAMENLVDEGLVKSIGLSNFNKRQIEHILKHCRIPPVNLQIEVHADLPNVALVDFAKSKNLTVTAYAPLGSPNPGDTKILLDESWVRSIAAHHGRTSAQVLIRWLLQRDLIVIPKSVNPQRIKENINVFDFQLTNEEMCQLSTMGSNDRKFKLLSMKGHPEYPFNEPF